MCTTNTEFIQKTFDLVHDNYATVVPTVALPTGNITAVTGPSGSGKSTLLRKWGYEPTAHAWSETLPLCESLGLGPEETVNILLAVGLGSVPAWLRPYSTLSNGEKFRADVAMQLAHHEKGPPLFIDEFTSTCDRATAYGVATSLRKYCLKHGIQLVVATCHDDILPWLRPDTVVSMPVGTLSVPSGLVRPDIQLSIQRVHREAWKIFAPHHYLTSDLNPSAKCFLVEWNGRPMAFQAIMNLPHNTLRNAWRSHRLVLLPEYQGLGLGVAISNWAAHIASASADAYYAKTAHPKLISYRVASPLWQEIKTKNKNPGLEYKWDCIGGRRPRSFKYVGPRGGIEEALLFEEKIETTK